MINENLPSQGPKSRSLRKRALLGTAAALVVGGVIAGEAIILPKSPALADAVRVDGVQPVSFADVVEKVRPAVVSVRVKTPAARTSLLRALTRSRNSAATTGRWSASSASSATMTATATTQSSVPWPARSVRHEPRLRLHHLGRRLHRHQRPRRRQGPVGHRHPRRRHRVRGEGGRRRREDRPRAPQDQQSRPQVHLREVRTRTPSASATGSWRSAIRSASAAP